MFRNTKNEKALFKENHTDTHIMEQLLISDDLRFAELPPIKHKYDLEQVLSHFEQHNDIPIELIDEESLGYILSDWERIKDYPSNRNYRVTKNIVERWC